MSTKAKIQKIRAEVEAHEERGWLKGYEEGLAKREQQIVEAQAALEARNERLRELSHQKNGPKTAREALELAWELAHPVKEGQAIPRGTRVIDHTGGTVVECTVGSDWVPREHENIRTLDPAQEPLPDWLKAQAVMADCLDCNPPGLDTRSVYVNIVGDRWTCTECLRKLPWQDMTNVTPLHAPQEEPSTGCYRDVFDTLFATKKDET